MSDARNRSNAGYGAQRARCDESLYATDIRFDGEQKTRPCRLGAFRELSPPASWWR
jgi:hypothetical protein